MPRLAHGAAVTPEQVKQARRDLAAGATDSTLFVAAAEPSLQDFGFMFGELQQDEANLLPKAARTNVRLKRLGERMVDPGAGEPGESADADIPAIYTYFGQFVDHDITLEATSFSPQDLVADDMVPLTLEQIRRDIKNKRDPTLELDSLYGPPAPRDPGNPDKMQIGRVTRLEGLREPPNLRVRLKGDDNDLPRRPRLADPAQDREALIGDPRNDENLIISQLHLAFLKAHNALVDQGNTFEQAQRLLRQHYQHIVVHDFLPRIADPAVVEGVLQNGNQHFDPPAGSFFTPLEFTVAAYRFGHSMIRNDYDFNVNFTPDVPLDLLFTFTALSGELGFDEGSDTLPDNWIIEWHRFVDTLTRSRNRARQIDTKLANLLSFLQDVQGVTLPDDQAKLAKRNLLRGYALRLPTGQAIARALGLGVLTPDAIKAAAASEEQARTLNSSGFLSRTPLWFYLLAEAKHRGPSGGKGQRLGKVGSTIVAEVLIGLARRSQDSILTTPGWKPTIPAAHSGRFELADLLRFAGVLSRTYRVQKGDTLRGIAKRQLRAEGRWAEIFVLNREAISHRSRLRAGRVFLLPGNTPRALRPRTHTVRAGDTLGGLARSHLGDVNRFPEIHELNRDVLGADPNRLSPGQELVILPP
jgi:nucleoid-associated protein YgaU